MTESSGWDILMKSNCPELEEEHAIDLLQHVAQRLQSLHSWVPVASDGPDLN